MNEPSTSREGMSAEMRLYADGKITASEYLNLIRKRIGQEVRDAIRAR